MRLKIVSDGTIEGTFLTDSETGKVIPGVQAINIDMDLVDGVYATIRLAGPELEGTFDFADSKKLGADVIEGPAAKVHIDDVVVVVGENPPGWPHFWPQVVGFERKNALSCFRSGVKNSEGPKEGYTFWFFMSSSGGSRRISPSEVAWETSDIPLLVDIFR
jgi:hypothetical protein